MTDDDRQKNIKNTKRYWNWQVDIINQWQTYIRTDWKTDKKYTYTHTHEQIEKWTHTHRKTNTQTHTQTRRQNTDWHRDRQMNRGDTQRHLKRVTIITNQKRKKERS